MTRITAILALVLALAWLLCAFLPLPQRLDPDGWAHVWIYLLISIGFLTTGTMALLLYRSGDLRWQHPTILFGTPILQMLSVTMPTPYNHIIAVAPIACIVITFGLELRK